MKVMALTTNPDQYTASAHLPFKTLVIALGSIPLTCLLAIILPWSITLSQAVWLQGCIAALICYFPLKMPVWWSVIHLLFLPTLSAAMVLDLPAIWYLISLITVLLIFGRTYRTRVPLFLSSRQAVEALGELLPQDRPLTMVDLGSGCGGLVCSLSSILPLGQFHGIEAALLPYWISRFRTLFSKRNCQFKWADIWKQNLADYDVVYAYLSPVPMAQLWQKAQQEMRPGSFFISNTFVVPNVQPDQRIPLNDLSNGVLYVWRMK